MWRTIRINVNFHVSLGRKKPLSVFIYLSYFRHETTVKMYIEIKTIRTCLLGLNGRLNCISDKTPQI